MRGEAAVKDLTARYGWKIRGERLVDVPLLPLALLLLTGLYFALPYATKWRDGRRADRKDVIS